MIALSGLGEEKLLVLRYQHALAFHRLKTPQDAEGGLKCQLSFIDRKYFEQVTMLVRQSPFNACDLVLLTEGSLFHRIKVLKDNSTGQIAVAEPYIDCSLGVNQ